IDDQSHGPDQRGHEFELRRMPAKGGAMAAVPAKEKMVEKSSVLRRACCYQARDALQGAQLMALDEQIHFPKDKAQHQDETPDAQIEFDLRPEQRRLESKGEGLTGDLRELTFQRRLFLFRILDFRGRGNARFGRSWLRHGKVRFRSSRLNTC